MGLTNALVAGFSGRAPPRVPGSGGSMGRSLISTMMAGLDRDRGWGGRWGTIYAYYRGTSSVLTYLFGEEAQAEDAVQEDWELPEGVILKDGVNIENLDPRLRDRIKDIADEYRKVYDALGIEKPAVITSGHRPDDVRSLHSKNKALDFRGRLLPDDAQDKLAHAIQKRLGKDFTVVSEHYCEPSVNCPRGSWDHIHVELQQTRDAARATVEYNLKIKRLP